MIKFLLCFFVSISFTLSAEEFTGEKNYKSWELAKKASSRIQFIVESTKAGIFSSDIDGYVKRFNFSGDFDKKNLILRNMKVSFNAKEMDSDNDSRDEKLHNLCMNKKLFPIVEIIVIGPLFLKSLKPSKLPGTALIRGKKKAFTIEIKGEYKDGQLSIGGKTVWGLKEMEIPDPSIFIAKLSNEIRINIKLVEKI